MAMLVVLTCAAACVACIVRNVALDATLPEPVFFGSDGFGCTDGRA